MMAQGSTTRLHDGRVASVYASLGEIDEAVRSYQKALDDRSPDMMYALATARLAPRLRENSDYRAILSRMRFPQPAT